MEIGSAEVANRRDQPLERLDPAHMRAVVTVYRDALRSHQERINRLNVYPVPDGDTGTNMALTLESVVEAIEGTHDMHATCTAIARGSLMGARGNSGVILSQILRGVSERCRGGEDIGVDDLVEALQLASDAAYKAVMRPVEGTILTVVREAAEAAGEAAAEGGALLEVLDAARRAADDAVQRTPELLPVLAEAGVVDAGGIGFALLLDALVHVVAGRPLPEPEVVETPAAVRAATEGGVGGDGGDGTGPRYEVMYFLEAPDEAVPAFKEAWAGIGDSIVVVGGDGTWNCHIHTDDVGAAVEAALDHGRPRQIRVTDLREQVEEESWVREGSRGRTAPGGAGDPATARSPGLGPRAGQEGRVNTAVAAVATGDGLRDILGSLGVQQVVAGGQSMNPSTGQILEAVEAAPADAVVVLPNNANIVPVAGEVDALTDKTVRVVPTRSVTEGLAALLAYDPGAPVDEAADAMGEAAAGVAWGEVTRAVRASSSPAGPIEEGDWLGLSSRRIEVVAPTLADAVTGLLDVLVAGDHEVVTLIEGEGADDEVTRRVTDWLKEHRPGVDVEVHDGGQPLYPYLLSAE